MTALVPNPRAALEQAQRNLADARSAALADEPLLAEADAVIGRLQSVRAENHWADKVRESFRSTRQGGCHEGHIAL